MGTELSYLASCYGVRRVEQRLQASNKLDIKLNTLYILYLVSVIPPPASFQSLVDKSREFYRMLSANQLSDRIKVLIGRGYITHNGWGKMQITPTGLNLLKEFDNMLRKQS